jgi:hypothetical protein
VVNLAGAVVDDDMIAPGDACELLRPMDGGFPRR